MTSFEVVWIAGSRDGGKCLCDSACESFDPMPPGVPSNKSRMFLVSSILLYLASWQVMTGPGTQERPRGGRRVRFRSRSLTTSRWIYLS
jgi:hypothetical protein